MSTASGTFSATMIDRPIVLVVDDEPDMLSMLQLVLEKKCGCRACLAASGLEALDQLTGCLPAVVLTDIKMPDLDGLELLKKIKKLDATISVVVMTGYGTIQMAVQALKDGAYDFVEKPFDQGRIVRLVQNCLERTALLRTNRSLQSQLRQVAAPEGFIGQSPALIRTLDLISRVADTDATILVRGKSGTGKELAARALHTLSNRSERAMVTVNCPALPEPILESELFGYSKGAFTGAHKDKRGLFLEADGSTILLDEIADIPVPLQTKLLRVLQEKEIQPLGQNRKIKVDVRVIASTNQDLETKIRTGEFREDLFYRLNVITITMPTLDEMKDDVPLLIHHFLDQFITQYQRNNLTVSPEALQHLYQRHWPGNVRELRNTIKRLVLIATHGRIELTDLEQEGGVPPSTKVHGEVEELFARSYNDAKETVIRRFNEQYLKKLLASHNGNVTMAAQTCGLSRQALQRIMRSHHIISSDYKTRT